jgi:putative protease
MTLSSPEGLALARSLGISRVVLPRELSTAEIRRLAAQTELELEVFVHGALCMSWSGQCLTSEAWGGRSANRGQCAQSCRLPYELVVDGVLRPLATCAYLLSPLDLAGMRAVPELVEIGVHSLKIEGRLKGPAYVAAAVHGYQRMLDAVEAGRLEEGARQAAVDLGQMAVTYSRGFSDGFFAGSDHQDLVEGRFPKHRGALLGRVAEVTPTAVRVTREARAPSVGAAVGGGLAVGTVSSPLPAMAGASADDVVAALWSAGAGPAEGPAGPPGVDELGPGGRRGRARGGGEAGVGAGAADDGRDGRGRRAGDHSLDRAGGGARGRAGAAGVGRTGAR